MLWCENLFFLMTAIGGVGVGAEKDTAVMIGTEIAVIEVVTEIEKIKRRGCPHLLMIDKSVEKR